MKLFSIARSIFLDRAIEPWEGRDMKTFSKCTLYRSNGVRICKIEMRTLTITIGAYAQFANAVRYTYRRKNSNVTRKTADIGENGKSTIVVLDGWGHPEPESFISGRTERYAVGSDDAGKAFDAMLSAYVAEGKGTIAADYRAHGTY